MKRLFVLLGLLLVQGCATITSPNSKLVHFQSTPPGATVSNSRGQECVTPCAIRMHGSDEQYVAFNLDGYAEQKKLLTTTLLNRTWLNLLFFWPGVVVDFATGAVWRYEPREVNLELKKL